MKNFLVVVMVMVSIGLRAQWVDATLLEYTEKILASEAKIDTKMSYSFNTHFGFYNDLTSTELALEYKGRIVSDLGKTLMIDQFNQLMLQDEQYNLLIDEEAKTVVLKPHESIYVHKKTMEEMSKFLNSQCIVKKMVSADLTKYSIEFAPGAHYKGCEVWFNRNDLVEKYILYAGTEVTDDTDFYNPKTIQPRLEVTYTDYKFGKEANLIGIKKVSDFIVVAEDKIVLAEGLEEFQLVDLRMEN